MKKTIEIPVKTAAALVMACTAIEYILTTETLTEDIKDELRTFSLTLTVLWK